MPPRGQCIMCKLIQNKFLCFNVCWLEFHTDSQSWHGAKCSSSPLALLSKRKMLTMSWFECSEFSSYHRHFISVLTHRCFLSSPIPKQSSQILLSHTSPLCFILPQSFMLSLPTLNFPKSLQTLVPPFSFHPSGSTRPDFSPSVVQAPWFTRNGCQFSSVQLLSRVWLVETSWTAACQASLSITNSWSLLKLMSIESVMPSNHFILCRPLLLLPSIFPSIRVFSNESVLCIRWPKYWSFIFNISPSNEHSGLISFRMDWLVLLVVQGTLKSLLQYHSSKTSISIFQCSAFFIDQLSHPYTTTGKTAALTRWTLVGKEMSLLFNMLSRLVIMFLPRSKRLLISWLQSPSAVMLEPPPKKSATVSTVSPSICHEAMGPDAMILVFWMLNFKPTFSLHW